MAYHTVDLTEELIFVTNDPEKKEAKEYSESYETTTIHPKRHSPEPPFKSILSPYVPHRAKVLSLPTITGTITRQLRQQKKEFEVVEFGGILYIRSPKPSSLIDIVDDTDYDYWREGSRIVEYIGGNSAMPYRNNVCLIIEEGMTMKLCFNDGVKVMEVFWPEGEHYIINLSIGRGVIFLPISHIEKRGSIEVKDIGYQKDYDTFPLRNEVDIYKGQQLCRFEGQSVLYHNIFARVEFMLDPFEVRKNGKRAPSVDWII